MASAKIKATIGMIIMSSMYLYYTVWILITPLIDEKHYL